MQTWDHASSTGTSIGEKLYVPRFSPRSASGSVPGRALLFLTLSGLATGASWVCYFRALKVGEVSKVAPVDKLSVVLVALFAVIFLGERPAFRDWVGIACVGAGVLLLSLRR